MPRELAAAAFLPARAMAAVRCWASVRRGGVTDWAQADKVERCWPRILVGITAAVPAGQWRVAEMKTRALTGW
jgi:hypothetical protein